MQKLTDIVEELNQLKIELTNKMKEKFKETYKEIFVQIPTLNAITFTAYTDYFNDGETCNYYVHSLVAVFSEFDEEDILSPEDYEYSEDDVNISYYTNYSKKLEITEEQYNLLRGFMNFIRASDSATFIKDMFGDHVQVTLTRDEIYIEEYFDHD